MEDKKFKDTTLELENCDTYKEVRVLGFKELRSTLTMRDYYTFRSRVMRRILCSDSSFAGYCRGARVPKRYHNAINAIAHNFSVEIDFEK